MWLGVLAVTALSSAGRFRNGAVWDDKHLIELARRTLSRAEVFGMFSHSTLGQALDLTHDSGASELDLYRPMTLLTFALDQLRGAGLFAYHTTNLALHLGCVTLVYWLGRELLGEPRRAYALLAAAWFGLSPHLAEAHVWISGRFDELSTFFGLGAILIWRHSARAQSTLARLCGFVACACAFALGLLSKEPLVFALPALALWPACGARPALRARLIALGPFCVSLGAYAVLRVSALHGSGTHVSAPELAAALTRWPALSCDAVANLVFPISVYARLMKEDYDAAGPTLLVLAAFACLGMAWWAFRLRARAPVFAWSLLWLAGTLAPVTLIATRSWPGFGRFLYLPASLFFVGLAELVALAIEHFAHLPRVQRAMRVGLALHGSLFALLLFGYTADFASDDTLFESIIAQAPLRSHGYAFLGMTYLERGRNADAAILLRRALRIAPFDRRYTQMLGKALLFSGQRAQALALARDAIQRLHPAPEFELLAAYAELDQPTSAAAHVLACLDVAPANQECRDALTFLLTKHPQATAFRHAFDGLCATGSGSGCAALAAGGEARRPSPAPW
jgi:tetratricopeptide (TPR) repeat protein